MKIKIPEGMMKAVSAALAEHWKGRTLADGSTVDVAIEAALRWLSGNPIVPPERETLESLSEYRKKNGATVYAYTWWAGEWQRRMFLAPEPEIPEEEVKDLLQIELTSIDPKPNHTVLDPRTTKLDCTVRQWNEVVLEAYRRGTESK